MSKISCAKQKLKKQNLFDISFLLQLHKHSYQDHLDGRTAPRTTAMDTFR